MKKIFSLVLVGVIMFSGINVFASDNTQEDDVIVLRTELAQLYDMGIMKDVGSGPYQNITRAEMAKIITQALAVSDVEMANTYTDVLNDNPHINHIGVVQSKKIMCGYGNNIFKPDADITYYEVVKTIVTMLGYEPLAQQKGGYPHGYLRVGNELGIILYPGAENRVINKDEIAKILLKALDVPLMEQISFGENQEYKISEQTIKDRYLTIE